MRVEQNPAFAETGFDWARLRPYMTEYDSVPDPVQRNAAYRQPAIHYVVQHPAHYALLVLRRFGRYWSPVIDQSEHFYIPRALRLGSVIWGLLIYVGIGATCATVCLPQWRQMAPLLVTILFLAGVHTAIHALVRYRAPLIPLLAVLSAGFLSRIGCVANGRWRDLVR
jgi:hypothetical protein